MKSTANKRRGGTGMGVLIGIGSTILILVLTGMIAMFAMGRCPMCGNTMNFDQPGMMQDSQ